MSNALAVISLTLREVVARAGAGALRWLFGSADGRLFGAVAALCILLMLFVDMHAAAWARELPEPVKQVGRVVTNFGKSDWWLYISAMFAALAAAVYGSRLYAVRAVFLFAGVALSGIAVNVLKVLFGRARPKLLHGEAQIYGFDPLAFSSSWQSFPSGHTSTAVAVALCGYIMLPRLWPLWLGLALAVAGSRVVVGAHYPADLVAGTYVTFLVVRALAGIAEGRGYPLRIRRHETVGR